MTRTISVSILLLCLRMLQAQPHIVINELMYAPKSPEPEWVELFNAGTDTVNLKDWHLSDKVKTHTLPSVIIAPNTFLILTSDTTKLKAKYPLDATSLIQGSLPVFNNDGDLIVLKDSFGIVIDSFLYKDSWGGSGGHSIERIDAEQASDSMNFSSSIVDSGGTPGLPNSIRRRNNDIAVEGIILISQNGVSATLGLAIQNKGKLSIADGRYSLFKRGSLFPVTTGTVSELLAPLAFDTIYFDWNDADLGPTTLVLAVSYDGDENLHNDTINTILYLPMPAGTIVINELMTAPASGSCQWVELYNRTASIANLEGARLVVHQSDTTFSYAVDSLIIRPKAFGTIAASDKIFINYPSIHSSDDVFVVGKTSTLHLPEDAGLVSFRNSDLTIIDSVEYDFSNYSTNLSPATGISLERKRPEGGSNDKKNWGASVAELGATPLAVNSILFDSSNSIPSVHLTVSPNPFSPDADGFEETTAIALDLPTDDESVFSIKIYDNRARLVRTISHRQRIVRSAIVAFDGKNDHGASLPVGIYTLIVEPITGSVQGAKTGIVIAKR